MLTTARQAAVAPGDSGTHRRVFDAARIWPAAPWLDRTRPWKTMPPAWTVTVRALG
ncbi:hypothetical protein [Dankookia sp. GCM10030260]|uniref:hypothetical protein n=1 Tax=Dankookia sp. GCM10030260 TaxID=3273390 RepID=UPI0036D260E2